MQSARVTGTIHGQQRTVDLLADRFVEKVDVDADRLADPAESVAYARQVLGKALRDRSDYLSRVVPTVDPTPSGHRAQFVENQDDGQPA